MNISHSDYLSGNDLEWMNTNTIPSLSWKAEILNCVTLYWYTENKQWKSSFLSS